MVEAYDYRHAFHVGERVFEMPVRIRAANPNAAKRDTVLHIPGYGDTDHARELLGTLAEQCSIPGISLQIAFSETPHQIASTGKGAVERVAKELVPEALDRIRIFAGGKPLQTVTNSIGSAIAGFGLEHGNTDTMSDLALINPAGLAYGERGRISPTTTRFLGRYFKAVSKIGFWEDGVRVIPLLETLAKDIISGPSRFAGQLAVINEATFGEVFARHAKDGNRIYTLSGAKDVLFDSRQIQRNLAGLRLDHELDEDTLYYDTVLNLRHCGGLMPEFTSTVNIGIGLLNIAESNR